MSATHERLMRIGEVAELTGTTPRTIRYYEEIGLLGGEPAREQGKHRAYTQADVDRVKEVLRLRDLLGLSLEQLAQLVDAETARAEIRKELETAEDPAHRRALREQALTHIAGQLELVRRRLTELKSLERELTQKQRLVRERMEQGA
jgi:MerR family transcriptional regulator, repressor of the yfmOP operon